MTIASAFQVGGSKFNARAVLFHICNITPNSYLPHSFRVVLDNEIKHHQSYLSLELNKSTYPLTTAREEQQFLTHSYTYISKKTNSSENKWYSTEFDCSFIYSCSCKQLENLLSTAI